MALPAWRGRISTYSSATDKTSAPIELESIEELAALLEHEAVSCTVETCKGKTCSNKDGTAWSAGYIPSGKRCLDGNVETVGLVVLDLDHLSQADVEDVCAKVEAAGLFAILHSTHCHKPPHDQAIRVVFPLARPVSRKEWPALWASVVARFDFPCDPKAKTGLDSKARNASRIFFLPRRPEDAPFINAHSEGELMNPDVFLLEHHARSRTAQQRVLTAPLPSEEGETDLASLRKKLASYDPEDDFNGEKREMVRRVLTGEPLADKPGCNTVAFGEVTIYGRDDAVFRAATIVGWQLPLGTPEAVAMELLRPTIAAIPEYEDDGKEDSFDSWMQKAKLKFLSAQEKKFEEMSSNNRLLAALHKRLNEHRRTEASSEGAPQPTAPTTPSGASQGSEGPPPSGTPSVGTAAAEESDEDSEEWRLRMKVRVLENGDMKPEQLSYNVALILREHPAWKDVLRFNEVTKDIECRGGPSGLDLRPNCISTSIEHWLQSEEGINLSSLTVEAQILHVARLNSFDPVRDYLRKQARPVWDEQYRLETMLETYFGAELESFGADITNYIRRAGVNWMISAVARGLNPGCKADNVLVLEGEQGLGKTTALEILGGPWYETCHNTLTDKDSKLQVAMSWIVELAELSAIRSTETEAQKSFFSSRFDRFRPPYARRLEMFPRHCVFAGTTNESDYLRDGSGNRRFWPITCTEIKLKELERDRDLLWAEAVARYDAGESWHFDKLEAMKAEEVTTTRLRGTDMADAIWAWWLKMAPTRRPHQFTIADVAVDALSIPKYQIDDAARAVGRALKRMGFLRRRLRDGGIRHYIYEPSNEHLGMPKRRVDAQHYLTLIAGANVPPEGEAAPTEEKLEE